MAEDWDTPKAWETPATPEEPSAWEVPVAPVTPEAWQTPVADGSGTGGHQPPTAFELRPLTLGEILDRTFTVYRSRFWLFAGIASFAAGLQTSISAIQLFWMGMGVGTFGQKNPAAITAMGVGSILALLLVGLLFFVALSVTQAATAHALSEVYLAHPTTIMESMRAIGGKWYRYIGITLWQLGSMIWIPVVCLIPAMGLIFTKNTGLVAIGGVLALIGVLGGLIGGYILYLRNALAIPATVIEGLTVRQSMRRSKVLAAGTKGRIFVVQLLAGALKYAASLLQLPLMMITMFSAVHGHMSVVTGLISLLVTFVGYTVVEPVLMIGLCLVYFDQRVRKEALDIVMLMGPEIVAAPMAVSEPVAVAEPVVAESIVASEPAPVEEVLAERVDHDQAGDEPLP